MRCKIKLCTYAKCQKIETVSSDGSTSKSNIRGSVLGKNKIPLETHNLYVLQKFDIDEKCITSLHQASF